MMSDETPGRRILLVEDEAMIAMLVEDMLEDLGHELVRVASRLEDAVAAAGNEAIDLAILDLTLGGALTYPAADVLAERGIPFVFATGYGSAGSRRPMPPVRPCKSRSTRRRWSRRSGRRSGAEPEIVLAADGRRPPGADCRQWDPERP